MNDRNPECELGNKLDQIENNKNIYSKFGFDALKVRPCERYNEEYKECSKLKSKFRDLYVSGIRTDCYRWYTDHRNCLEFRKDKDVESFEKVLNSEKKRVEERLNESKKNNVWTYRDKPPEDFNSALPNLPKSDRYSPFEVYESIKAKRKEHLKSKIIDNDDVLI